MYFSDVFGLSVSKATDWFDPILSSDTKLWVDPFLVFKDTKSAWEGSHAELIEHFEYCYKLVAKAGGPSTLPYQQALALLRAPEPKEFCLGYTAKGTAGAGSGPGLGKEIIEAMRVAIATGLDDLDHFEMLGILNERFGVDRISDVTCNVLRHRFITYTEKIAKQRGIPRQPHELAVLESVAGVRRYTMQTFSLPTNPFTGGPILLVPKRFLRPLPTINAYDWWSSTLNADLRAQINATIQGSVGKAKIVELARQYPDRVRAWVKQAKTFGADPYDVIGDPLGRYLWARHATEYVADHPKKLQASNDSEMDACIEAVVEEFRHFIEDQGGWKLLWHKTEEKHEEAGQLLFRGLAAAYCRQSGISVDREVNLGCGTVDFKFSTGYSRAVHLEVKKVHNGKFWEGLEVQLPKYMASDQTNSGWFVALRLREGGVTEERLKDLPDRVEAAAKTLSLSLRHAVVDGRRQESASKLPKKPS